MPPPAQPLAPLDVRPFVDFEEACQKVLEYLEERLGFGLWMVTRTSGDDWIVLSAQDSHYGVSPGDVFRWSDSFCYHMVQDAGPRVAPRSADVPRYAEAPIGRQVPIGAYVGVPLVRAEGTLFGTLCAIDPAPQSEAIAEMLPEVELLARLLSTVLEADLAATDARRRLERAESEANQDVLTGVLNRRGWQLRAEAEEERCRRYGHPLGVIVVDLDDLKEVNDRDGHSAGDRLLRTAAERLVATCRINDVVARLGGDEFGVMAVESGPLDTERLVRRIEKDLGEAGVRASVGWATRRPEGGLIEALAEADQRMYDRKRRQSAPLPG